MTMLWLVYMERGNGNQILNFLAALKMFLINIMKQQEDLLQPDSVRSAGLKSNFKTLM